MVASDFKKGDEVFGLAYGGAYAEYIVVSVKMIVYKPKELSFEQCAGIPEVWFTAIQALYLVGSMRKGMNVLFHAGASSNPSFPSPSIPPSSVNVFRVLH
jgi:NADPH2:quinone reductase